MYTCQFLFLLAVSSHILICQTYIELSPFEMAQLFSTEMAKIHRRTVLYAHYTICRLKIVVIISFYVHMGFHLNFACEGLIF